MAKLKQKTRAELQREVKELTAQLTHTAHFAAAALKKFGTDRLTGSAVIVEVATLGGRAATGPFAIRDGFSPATIAALIADLERTYAGSILFKPEG